METWEACSCNDFPIGAIQSVSFVEIGKRRTLNRIMRDVEVSSLGICYAFRLPLPPVRRPRLRKPVCCTRSLPTIAAAAVSALLLAPDIASAKGILSTNTIFRRYVVTDADAILRYALPLPSERYGNDPVPIRGVQEQLERLGVDLRARGAAGQIGGRRDISRLKGILSSARLDILLDVPAKKRQAAADYLSQLENCVIEIEQELGFASPSSPSTLFPPQLGQVQDAFSDALARRNAASKRTNYDASFIESKRQQALDCVAQIEELAVEGTGLPFRIPRRYNSFPRLKGRATVQIKLKKPSTGKWYDENGDPVGSDTTLTAVLDGYSAPLTAGNFIDIAKRGYYNNTRVLASQRAFYAQLGEREDDKVEGFQEPSTGKRRQIPLEILVDGEPTPNYGATLDELGIGDLQPVLPITAYGALAMVHSVEDANDASSQFYVFLLDPESYTARSFGGSVLTGSLSTFGYVVDGREYLSQLQSGDVISSVEMKSGGENFAERGDN